MKFFLFITLFLYLSNCLSEDYTIEFHAKVKNSIEYNISKTKKFKNYDLEGTFTDSYGNIGTFGAVIIADVDKGRLVRLDSTAENIYSNNEISKIEIYDLFGKKLLVKEKENLKRVKLSQLSSGVYLVKIFSRKMIEVKRIIKK